MPAYLRARSSGFALLGAACGLLPVAAQAQWEVVVPYVGLYRPTTILASASGAPLGGGGARVDTVKQQGSVTLGMRVTLWGPGRLGIEGTVGSAPSSLWSSYPYRGGPVYSADVLTVSAKALLRLTPPAARAALRVGAGVGLVGHGGDAYPQWYTGPRTFLSGIASIGGVITVAPWVGLRFDAEDFVYAAHLGPCTRTGPGSGSVCDVYSENAGRSTGSRLQHDLVLSLGFAFTSSRTARPGAP
jgi:hypothetical protein